jgi:hypothetical protein
LLPRSGGVNCGVPPLSEVKTMIVSFRSASRSRAATILATFRSTPSIVAA